MHILEGGAGEFGERRVVDTGSRFGSSEPHGFRIQSNRATPEIAIHQYLYRN